MDLEQYEVSDLSMTLSQSDSVGVMRPMIMPGPPLVFGSPSSSQIPITDPLGVSHEAEYEAIEQE